MRLDIEGRLTLKTTESDDVILRSMKRLMHVTMGLAFQDEVEGTEAVVGRQSWDILDTYTRS